MPAAREQLRIRELIWERVRDRLTASPNDRDFEDPVAFAERLLIDFPCSGLSARRVAAEIQRIRHALRHRRPL